MKINVIGPSACGKSWVAKRLSEETGIQIHSTDDLLHKHGRFTRSRDFDHSVLEDDIANIIAQEKWILEGKYFCVSVFQRADHIVLLDKSLVNRLLIQWYRFVTETEQREKYGLKRNLRLSKSIIRQHYGLYNNKILHEDKRKYSRAKVKSLTRGFEDKLMVVKGMRDVEKIMKKISG